MSAASFHPPGFTLVELLVAMALMAVLIPVIVQGLRVATLAGEVSQRKALAVRIAERVLNETILTGQSQSATAGNESAGPYQFHWTIKNEPWSQLSGLAMLTTSNGINQAVVNQNNIHELSVDVTYAAQNRNFSVHLSTIINVAQQ